jgi:hypothetical protein
MKTSASLKKDSSLPGSLEEDSPSPASFEMEMEPQLTQMPSPIQIPSLSEILG